MTYAVQVVLVGVRHRKIGHHKIGHRKVGRHNVDHDKLAVVEDDAVEGVALGGAQNKTCHRLDTSVVFFEVRPSHSPCPYPCREEVYEAFGVLDEDDRLHRHRTFSVQDLEEVRDSDRAMLHTLLWRLLKLPPREEQRTARPPVDCCLFPRHHERRAFSGGSSYSTWA